MEQKIVSLNKYVYWFLAAYITSSTAIGAVLIYFGLDSNSPSAVIIAVSGLAAVGSFAKDHKRIPSKRETWSLTLRSWFSSILVSVIFASSVIAYSLYDVYGQISFTDIEAEFSALGVSLNFIYVVTFIVLIFHLGLTRFAYWLGNKISAKKLGS